MSQRAVAGAEDTSVRLLLLMAGIALAFLAAPAIAQEEEAPEPGVEAAEPSAEETGEAEEGEKSGEAEEPAEGTADAEEEPKVDPREEARRKQAEEREARTKAKEDAQKAAKERRAVAEARKAARKKARTKAKEDAQKAADEARKKKLDAREAAQKAKIMARKMKEEEARKRREAKERGERLPDEAALAEIRKPERELMREAQIAAAGVVLPADLRLTYLWSLPFEREVSRGDVWVHRDIILLLADESVLYCIRKRDGVPLWAIELGGRPFYRPALSNRMIYVFVNNRFVGIDRSRGEVIWRIMPKFAPSAAPCIAEPNMYVPAWDKRVHAIEVRSRKRVFFSGVRGQGSLSATEYEFIYFWHKTTGGHILNTPVLLDGFLYFGSEDGYLYSVSQDGEDRYRTQTQGPIRGAATSRGANVYVGSSDCSAYAFDRLTGSQNWAFPTGSRVTKAIYPDIPSGVAFVISRRNGVFGVMDRMTAERGSELWHLEDAEYIAGISKDLVYFVLNDKRLAAVEKKTGFVRWMSLQKGVREVVENLNDWTRSDDLFRLVCLTESGHLVCLREPKEALQRALRHR